MEARTGAVSVLSVIRSGGVALIVGGVLLIVYIILQVVAGSPADPENVVKTTFSLAFHIRVAAVLFILLGLVGLFIQYIGWIGPVGLTAFVLAFVGTALFGAETHGAVIAFPFIAEHDAALFESFLRSPTSAVLGIAGLLLLLVGYIMLGIVLFRSKPVTSLECGDAARRVADPHKRASRSSDLPPSRGDSDWCWLLRAGLGAVVESARCSVAAGG